MGRRVCSGCRQKPAKAKAFNPLAHGSHGRVFGFRVFRLKYFVWESCFLNKVLLCSEADGLPCSFPPAPFSAALENDRQSVRLRQRRSRGLDWPKFDYGSQSPTRRRRRPSAEARRGGDTEASRVESWLCSCLRASDLPRFRNESFCSCLVGLGRCPIRCSVGNLSAPAVADQPRQAFCGLREEPPCGVRVVGCSAWFRSRNCR